MMKITHPAGGIRCVLAAVLCAAALLMTGCGTSAEPEPPREPVAVYDDGAYLIASSGCERSEADGTGCVLARLLFTNNSAQSVALSSVYGLTVTVNGEACAVLSVPRLDSALPVLDGLVRPGECREGCIAFRAPEGAEVCEVSLAVDYLAGSWISFTLCQP